MLGVVVPCLALFQLKFNSQFTLDRQHSESFDHPGQNGDLAVHSPILVSATSGFFEKPDTARQVNNISVVSPYSPSYFVRPKVEPRLSLNRTLQHPFLGAADAHGRLGFIHDSKAHLRPEMQRTFLLSHEDQSMQTTCNHRNQSESSMEKSIVSQAVQRIQILPPPAHSVPARVMCCIYTHRGAVNQTEAILQTWGRKCDGLLFASTFTDPTEHSLHVEIRHKSKWEGGYKGLWQRLRAIFAYVYLNFMQDYDYFHFCGDDTFLIVENLKAFVSSPPVVNLTMSNHPFFAGFWTHWGDGVNPKKRQQWNDFYYLGGGPGYTMNARALQLFVEKVSNQCPKRHNDGSTEDLFVSWCFRYAINLVGYDTRDELGAHRYHLLNLEQHALFPEFMRYGIASHIVKQSLEFMNDTFGFPLVWGLDYISTQSVAFHNYKTPAEMKQMEFLLYGTGQEQCPIQNTTGRRIV